MKSGSKEVQVGCLHRFCNDSDAKTRNAELAVCKSQPRRRSQFTEATVPITTLATTPSFVMATGCTSSFDKRVIAIRTVAGFRFWYKTTVSMTCQFEKSQKVTVENNNGCIAMYFSMIFDNPTWYYKL
uniref:ZP domain-containing protein n=1 Tax=Panagrellus redivivus TaxID=6233 RepID=A0A7E4ULB5_PANRE